jgi:hypothetical protein
MKGHAPPIVVIENDVGVALRFVKIKVYCGAVDKVVEFWMGETFMEDSVSKEELVGCSCKDAELDKVITGKVGAASVARDKQSRWFKVSKTSEHPWMRSTRVISNMR